MEYKYNGEVANIKKLKEGSYLISFDTIMVVDKNEIPCRMRFYTNNNTIEVGKSYQIKTHKDKELGFTLGTQYVIDAINKL